MARVLRVPYHDSDSSFVLLHISRSSGHTSSPLDLTLVGTEGVAPYLLTLSKTKVAALKIKNSPCSPEEWSIIVESKILGERLEDSHRDLLDGIEAVAFVTQNRSIDITIRKRTEGITQRLGAFQLAYAEDQEIELFEWCGLAVQSSTAMAHRLSLLESKFQEQQETISKLNDQLEELIAAKASHETQLLEKFKDLLNEKKSKIRDQQRLLTSAKMEPKKLEEVPAASRGKKSGQAIIIRSGKRKAALKDDPNLTEEDVASGSDKMDVDSGQVPGDSGQDNTSAQEEEETADEDSEEDDLPPIKPPGRNTRLAKSAQLKAKQRTINQHNSEASSNTKKPSNNETNENTRENTPTTPPPRRDLPFAKKLSAAAASVKPKVPAQTDEAEEQEETASEDDEL